MENSVATVSEEYLIELTERAKDSEYYRGRVDGMEYVIDAIRDALMDSEA